MASTVPQDCNRSVKYLGIYSNWAGQAQLNDQIGAARLSVESVGIILICSLLSDCLLSYVSRLLLFLCCAIYCCVN